MSDPVDTLLDAIAAGDMDTFDRIAAKVRADDEKRQRQLNATGAMKRAAEWYASKGIPVFAIVPKGKKPIARSAHRGSDQTCKGECGQLGHGLYDATTDKATIARWWTRNPLANIGMPTGRWCDVIDIDGPAGYRAFAELREAGGVPEVLARSITPSGGMHVFVPPTGEGNGTKILDEIDYRGDGGYVLLPPSYVVETEKGYEGRYIWTTQPDWRKPK